MKNYVLRKVIAIFTFLILLLTPSTVLASEGNLFKDMDKSSAYAREAITELANMNIIQGSDGNFNPTQTINRAEMITMIVRSLEIDTENLPETATFKDVPKGHWAFKYVEAAYRAGITEGISDNEFGKDIKATREQMAAMFIRSLGVIEEGNNLELQLPRVTNLLDTKEISDWAKNDVELTLASGLMVGMGDNSFAPKGHAKREQMAVVIHRLINNQESIIEKIIETATPQKIKYQSLYNAMVKVQNSYQGEMEVKSTFTIKDLSSEESFIMTMDGISKINKDNIHTISKSIISANNTTEEEISEIIYVDGTLYAKYPGNDEWLNAGEVSSDISPINENFLLNFNKYNIANNGEVEIEGEKLTKYTLRLTLSDAISMLQDEFAMPEDLFGDNESIEEQFKDIEYIAEIYVSEDEQIVKSIYSLNTSIQEDGVNNELSIEIIIDYKNIGVEYIITAPEDAIVLDFNEDFDSKLEVLES